MCGGPSRDAVSSSCHTGINPPLCVWLVLFSNAKLPKSGPGYTVASTPSPVMAGTSHFSISFILFHTRRFAETYVDARTIFF